MVRWLVSRTRIKLEVRNKLVASLLFMNKTADREKLDNKLVRNWSGLVRNKLVGLSLVQAKNHPCLIICVHLMIVDKSLRQLKIGLSM